MPETLRLRALKLLTRREHSRAELKQMLAAYALSEDEVETALNRLQAEHLLSDHRFASQRVAARAGRYGNGRLRQELRGQGVGDDDIAAALDEGGDETERCRAVWRKKFDQLPDSPEERARQQRFLQYRGFSGDAVRKVLRGDDE